MRITISLPNSLYEKAAAKSRCEDFPTVTAYIQHLIREDTRDWRGADNRPAPPRQEEPVRVADVDKAIKKLLKTKTRVPDITSPKATPNKKASQPNAD